VSNASVTAAVIVLRIVIPFLCFIETVVPVQLARASLNAHKVMPPSKLTSILLEESARIKT
jgi:hypothetical protein